MRFTARGNSRFDLYERLAAKEKTDARVPRQKRGYTLERSTDESGIIFHMARDRGGSHNAAWVGFFNVLIGVFGLWAAIIALLLFIFSAVLIFRRPQTEGEQP